MKNIIVVSIFFVLLVVSMNAQQLTMITDGDSNTVAQWHFDEGAGNVLYDASIYQNHGEIHNGNWVKGKFGSGLHFNGVNSYVRLPNSNSLKTSKEFTVELLFAPDTTNYKREPDDIPSLLGNLGVWPSGGGWIVYLKNATEIGFNFRAPNNGSLFTSTIPLNTPKVFYHVAIVYQRVTNPIQVDDSITVVKTYFNGVLTDSSTFTQEIQYSNTPNFYIGTNVDGRAVGGGYMREFAGIIDEIRISKVARKPSEFWKPENFIATVFSVSDSITPPKQLLFGVHTNATYCLDYELGEYEFPPMPPTGVFDARFVDTRSGAGACLGQGVNNNFHGYFDSTQVDTYKVRFQPSGAGYPIIFSWSSVSELYSGSVRLTGGGGTINIDMKSVNSFLLEDEEVDRLTIYAEGPILRVPEEPQAFTDIGANLFPLGAGTSAWGDYDRDGDLDLLINGHGDLDSVRKSIIYNNDNGVFTDIGANLVGVISSKESNWCDFDNDGDLDVFIAGSRGPSTGNTVAKLYRNTNSIFEDAGAAIDSFLGTHAWGDFDNDGDVDLLTSGSANKGVSYSTKLYRNDNGAFVVVNTNLPGLWGASADWGDYDNDGDLDVALLGYGSGGTKTTIYRNDGPSSNSGWTFTNINPGFPLQASSSIGWGDYDNDGDLDVLLVGPFASTIYRNDGSSSNSGWQFTNTNTNFVRLEVTAAEFGDYEGDGDLDVLMSGRDFANSTFRTIVYRNMNGQFTELEASFEGGYYSSVDWGDYDNDGDLDIAVIGFQAGTEPYQAISKIYRNEFRSNVFRMNTIPSTPTGLTASVSGDNVTLRWNGSFDTQTPSPGLTYNLWVGNTLHEAGIVSPMASEAGYRRIVKDGNSGHCTSWTLKNLPAGTYTWTVQAIDGAFAGSNFASKHSFIIEEHNDSMFTDIDAGLSGRGHGTVTWGDYDNDGDLDLLLNGAGDYGTDRKTYVYRNDNGTFTDINANLVGVINNQGTSWGDFDNDDDLDILINGSQGPTYNTNPTSKIFRNNNGTFTDINASLTPIQGISSWGDFDNDGDLDVFITGSPDNGYSYTAKLYRNNNGNFAEVSVSIPGLWGSSVDWGDYDNDGDPDLALSGYGTVGTVTTVYRNDGASTSSGWIFTNINPGFTLQSRAELRWGDYDKDGDLDILSVGERASTIYRNDGNNSFVNTSINFAKLHASSAEFGDYDSDGDLDVLVAGRDLSTMNYKTIVYLNQSGQFIDLEVSLEGVYYSSVDWGDYDNDGDLDIAICGFSADVEPYQSVTKIYRNDLRTHAFQANTIPTTPGGLLASVNKNNVMLTWNASSDGQTPQTGLTYNLRIGTSAGGVQTQSPLANTGNGWRRLVKFGNTNHNRNWTIKNLPQGTYYWSVQAIDGAFAGSAFATEGTFTVVAVPSGPEPFLESVTDVPADQGGRVTLRWTKSSFDSRINSVTHYSIWRAIPYLPAKMDIEQDKLLMESSEKTIRRFTFNGTEYAWEKIGEQEAHQFAMYSYTAPTLYNASEEMDGKHYFLISAQTWDVKVFYDSNVDSGFSVDNVMPNIPGNIRAELNGQSVILRWNETGDTDIARYDVYRGATPDISPTNSTFVGSSKTTQFTDANPNLDEAMFYSIRAKDVNGNFGNFSPSIAVMLTNNGLLQSRGGIPETFAMYQNYPNPFNPSTTIWFDVKEAGMVLLNIYNTLGENVATLVEHNLPAGKYETVLNASAMTSGVYFYQLKIQSNNGTDFVSTKKFLLMR